MLKQGKSMRREEKKMRSVIELMAAPVPHSSHVKTEGIDELRMKE